jgi:long-chain-fatty-acid---luciferin-component ligase
MLRFENPDILVFNLGPDADEAKNLWIAYVMAGVSVMLPKTRNYVRDGAFALEEAIADLAACAGERIAVIGPPPLVLELARGLAARRVVLDVRSDSGALTIGGWKRRSGERIPRRDFDGTVAASFGFDEKMVRDSFNMVELNSVVVECEQKKLHIPPWLYVRARDPGTLARLASGQSGVLAYLDPTPTSYPGFVLSDDLGAVDFGVACGCGRTSDILRIERRLNTMESRGCALKMDTTRA